MKALLVDLRPKVLAELQAAASHLGQPVHLVGVACGRAACIFLDADPEFELVLFTLRVGDADGIARFAELRSRHPSVPVIVVAAAEADRARTQAIYLEAMGVLPHASSQTLVTDASRAGTPSPRSIPGQPSLPAPRPSAVAAGDLGVGLDRLPWRYASTALASLAALGLTPRRTEVLALLLEGRSNKLIARALNLSVETVKDHVAGLLRTLNVRSRTQAVLAVGRLSPQATHPAGWARAYRAPSAAQSASDHSAG